MTWFSCSDSCPTCSSHDLASPPRPPMSLSALDSWTVARSTCSSRDAILSIASLSAASSAATFFVTASSFVSAAAFESLAALSSTSAAASCLRFGSTSLET